MKLNKAQELAEQAIYEHTSSTKWQEVKYMKWTTSEMQDVIAKALVKNLSLSDVSQQRELLAFRKWQKDNWKDVYLYSNEFMIREFKKANCG
jgi:hypothetical protein